MCSPRILNFTFKSFLQKLYHQIVSSKELRTRDLSCWGEVNRIWDPRTRASMQSLCREQEECLFMWRETAVKSFLIDDGARSSDFILLLGYTCKWESLHHNSTVITCPLLGIVHVSNRFIFTRNPNHARVIKHCVVSCIMRHLGID